MRILAECRAGKLLKTIPRTQGKKGNGLRSTLERSEIAIDTAHRWQTMAPLVGRERIGS